jgi:small GTP-binding protein
MLGFSANGDRYRIVTIGDSTVGKTSIVNRLTQTDFDVHEPATIAATFLLHDEDVQGTRVQMQIWDTAGQERFRSLGSIYYRNAAAALVVFDLTNSKTWENIDGWITVFVEFAAPKPVVFIIGNKSDLVNEIQVDEAVVREWAEKRSYVYFSTSAMTGANVRLVFATLARALLKAKPPKGEASAGTREMQLQDKAGGCGCWRPDEQFVIAAK